MSAQVYVNLPASKVTCRNFVAGNWQDMSGSSSFPVTSPYTGEVIGETFESNDTQIAEAVSAADAAATSWKRVPIKERSATLLSFRALVLRDIDKLSHCAAGESGKTVSEAKAEILKGIEVIEFAASLQNSDLGGAAEVSRGVTCEYRREGLGVTVGITPFNFPAMVPMWMFPIAITMGNAFILKPSEKVPLTSCLVADLMKEAGYPSGVFSLIHGTRATVERLIKHPLVKAVAFVGSSGAAKSVYTRATSLGKRALCLGGAKNHLLLAPDADPAVAVDGIVSSFTGCAGQRCMAASVLVAIGDVEPIINRVVDKSKALRLGADMGALIDASARERLNGAIERAVAGGGKLLLDGRATKPPEGYAGGSWLAPTIIEVTDANMECACTELFGPVLTIIRTKTVEEALQLEHKSLYGNALSIFTTNGGVARYVAENAASGMVGINVGVPVPREPFSFGGTKESKFGACDITGYGGVEFWSYLKKITSKWGLQSDRTWMS